VKVSQLDHIMRVDQGLGGVGPLNLAKIASVVLLDCLVLVLAMLVEFSTANQQPYACDYSRILFSGLAS